jgi:hypothetical protein
VNIVQLAKDYGFLTAVQSADPLSVGQPLFFAPAR